MSISRGSGQQGIEGHAGGAVDSRGHVSFTSTANHRRVALGGSSVVRLLLARQHGPRGGRSTRQGVRSREHGAGDRRPVGQGIGAGEHRTRDGRLIREGVRRGEDGPRGGRVDALGGGRPRRAVGSRQLFEASRSGRREVAIRMAAARLLQADQSLADALRQVALSLLHGGQLVDNLLSEELLQLTDGEARLLRGDCGRSVAAALPRGAGIVIGADKEQRTVENGRHVDLVLQAGYLLLQESGGYGYTGSGNNMTRLGRQRLQLVVGIGAEGDDVLQTRHSVLRRHGSRLLLLLLEGVFGFLVGEKIQHVAGGNRTQSIRNIGF